MTSTGAAVRLSTVFGICVLHIPIVGGFREYAFESTDRMDDVNDWGFYGLCNVIHCIDRPPRSICVNLLILTLLSSLLYDTPLKLPPNKLLKNEARIPNVNESRLSR